MPKLHRFLLFLLLGCALPAGALYLFLFIAVNPKTIQDSLVRNVEEMTQGEFSFRDFQISFFPKISAEVKEAALSLENSKMPAIRAAKVRFHWTLWSFLFRRSDLSQIEASGAETAFRISQVQPVSLENIVLKLGPIRSGIPLAVEIMGDLNEIPKSIWGSLVISSYSKGRAWEWPALGLEGKIKLNHIPLSRLKLEGLNFFKNTVISQGEAKAEAEFFKRPGASSIEARGKAECRELSYAVHTETGKEISPAFDGKLEFDVSWDPFSGDLEVKRSVLENALIGKIEASGNWHAKTREFKNIHVKGSEISLDGLPQYYLGIRDAIPVNIGFSGRSFLEMSLEGTLDHLSLHVNWDLGPALLAYAPYFAKPKDVPLNVVLDLILEKREILSGNFTAKIKEAVFKGSLTGFNIHSGKGQLNIITNKFSIAGWEPILPPFENYSLQGEVKILANFAGDFIHNPQDVQRMLNLTMDKGAVVSKNGLGLREIFFTLDYGAIAVEAKNVRFEAGNSPVSLSAVLYDPFGDSSFRIKMDSPRFSPYAFWAVAKEWGSDRLPPNMRKHSKDALGALTAVLPPSEALENFSAELVSGGGGLALSELRFDVYEGQGKAKGKVDWQGPKPAYFFEGEVNRINLAEFFSREEKQNKILEGNFFAAFAVQGGNLTPALWTKGLKGEGNFSITNGEFHTFNLLDTISKIKGFASLSQFVSPNTRFDDLRSSFIIAGEKIKTKDLRVIASDYSIHADGEVAYDGVVNYRLDVFLPVSLAGGIISNAGGLSGSEGKTDFGPIPFLMSGRLENLDLKPDPILLPQLQDNLAKRKTQRVLRNFLSEEFFFKRSASP